MIIRLLKVVLPRCGRSLSSPLDRPWFPRKISALSAIFFATLGLPVFASTATPVTLPNSIKTVEAAPTSGPINPHRALITRRTLKAEESSALMTFEVTLNMRDLSDLQARVAQGEHIKPAEMAARYEPSAADYQSVVDWLTARGFTITRLDPHHLAVFVQGTVSQIQSALRVDFARVALEGNEYTSAVSPPQVDSSIASLVLGINGLQPQNRKHKHLIKAQASPNASGGSASYFPSQIAQAYTANLSGQGLTGAGQSIAIVIDTFPATSDLVSFWQEAGVSQSLSDIDFIQVVAGTLGAPSGEESLDVEWSSSIAPQAKVRIYATTDLSDVNLDAAYSQVYSDVTAHPEYGIHQMSMSYGGGETYTTKSQANTDDQYFAELATAGVSVFASSGDGGSTPGSKGGVDESGPVQVENPASDPNVTGVGGTSLVLNSDNSVNLETVWNNNSSASASGATGGGASGGGVSIYFARPSWQTGNGVPGGSMRYVPDIACSADPYYGAVVQLNGSEVVYGGTSWASPTCAGFCALLNQARSSAGQASIGMLNSHVYSLIGTANFHDITVSDNTTSTSGGDYPATTGYDEATGIGSPFVQALGQSLTASSAIQGVAVSPGQQQVPPGRNATIVATAGGSPVSYQWQAENPGSTTFSNIANGSSYSGATSSTLVVTTSGTSLSGTLYRCVVTYASTSITSAASTLVVDTPVATVTVAGTAGTFGNVNGTGTSAQFAYPSGVALDSSGNLFVADYNNNDIREITPSGVVSTPYGSTNGGAGSGNGTGNAASFNKPNDLAIDSSNRIYVADTGNNSIREINTTTGAVSTLATGFNQPQGVRVDASSTVFVADTGNNVIKKIINGTVSVLAGRSGNGGYVNATGTSARFRSPLGLAVDGSDNVYVADFGNAVVRKITSAGVVTTVAGTPSVGGWFDGPVAQALFNAPLGLALDGEGDLFVTDALVPATTSRQAGNDLLRKITPSGIVSTLAGNPGVAGSVNGTGTAAQFYSLQAATISGTGEIFLADTYSQLIRAAGLPPSLLSQPLSQVITVGQSVTFAVSATGSGTITYQWNKNGTAIPGATASSYTIASVAATDAGAYSVTVGDPFGSVTSISAALIPVAAQPMAQTVPAGGSATFSINVAGNGGPFSYQWLFNGSPISGATNSSYTIATVSSANAGNYSVLVTDSYGTATTMTVTLTVGPAAPVVATDTPAMPVWGMFALGALLFTTSLLRQPRLRSGS